MMGRWSFWGYGLIVLIVSFCFSHQGMAEERYTVRPGDTLSSISKSFGMTLEALKKANGLAGDAVKPKQVLVIPTLRGKPSDRTGEMISGNTVKKNPGGTESYVVKKGDSLYLLSKKTGLSIEEIKKMNHLSSTSLRMGQALALPRMDREEEAEEAEELGDLEELTGDTLIGKENGKQEGSWLVGKWNGSEERNLLVRVAKTFQGVPYRLGGSTLKGIDCSAFVKKIYHIFNTDLPRTAREQLSFGKGVKREELEEGDLVFFNTRRNRGPHVGIYIGNNEFIHASSRKKEVKVDNLDKPYFNKRFLRGVRVKELEKET